MCFLAVRPLILEFWSVQFGVDLWKNEWVPQPGPVAFWTRTRISFLSILDLRSRDFPNIANLPGLQESSILIPIVVAIRLNLCLKALCMGVSNCCGQGPAMPLDGLWLEALQYYLSNPGNKTNAQKYSKTLEPVQELLLLESGTGRIRIHESNNSLCERKSSIQRQPLKVSLCRTHTSKQPFFDSSCARLCTMWVQSLWNCAGRNGLDLEYGWPQVQSHQLDWDSHRKNRHSRCRRFNSMRMHGALVRAPRQIKAHQGKAKPFAFCWIKSFNRLSANKNFEDAALLELCPLRYYRDGLAPSTGRGLYGSCMIWRAPGHGYH